MRKIFAGIIFLAVIFYIAESYEEKIFVIAETGSEEKIITSVNAEKDLPLTIKFIHSVQKTPVTEELKFNGKEFVLLRTKYKSHGVGLPFMNSDGDFSIEDGFFVMDNMNRQIKRLELRTGTGTKHTINLAGQEIKLYEEVPPGTKIKFVFKSKILNFDI